MHTRIGTQHSTAQQSKNAKQMTILTINTSSARRLRRLSVFTCPAVYSDFSSHARFGIKGLLTQTNRISKSSVVELISFKCGPRSVTTTTAFRCRKRCEKLPKTYFFRCFSTSLHRLAISLFAHRLGVGQGSNWTVPCEKVVPGSD